MITYFLLLTVIHQHIRQDQRTYIIADNICRWTGGIWRLVVDFVVPVLIQPVMRFGLLPSSKPRWLTEFVEGPGIGPGGRTPCRQPDPDEMRPDQALELRHKFILVILLSQLHRNLRPARFSPCRRS